MKTEPAPATDLTEGLNEDIKDLPGQVEDLTVDLFHWLRADSLSVLAAIGIGCGLYFLLVLARSWLRRRLKHKEVQGSLSWVMLKVLAHTGDFFLIMLSARLVTAGLSAPGTWSRLIGFLFTISVAIQGALWARTFLKALLQRRAIGEEDAAVSSAMGVLTVLINVVVWTLTAIILLDNLGVNVTALMAGLGIGGIAIGLAAQGIFSDLFAALSILLDKPFKQGETIQVGGPTGVVGTVENIGMKTTRLRAQSGEVVVMSNTFLLGQQINNFADYTRRRVEMKIDVIYQTTPELLKKLPGELKAIIKTRPICEYERASLVSLMPHAIQFELVYFVNDPGMMTALDERQVINLAILQRFTELGIDLAYPTTVQMQALPDGSIFDPRELEPAPPAQKAKAELKPNPAT